jgi:hypothetical protein
MKGNQNLIGRRALAGFPNPIRPRDSFEFKSRRAEMTIDEGNLVLTLYLLSLSAPFGFLFRGRSNLLPYFIERNWKTLYSTEYTASCNFSWISLGNAACYCLQSAVLICATHCECIGQTTVPKSAIRWPQKIRTGKRGHRENNQ